MMDDFPTSLLCMQTGSLNLLSLFEPLLGWDFSFLLKFSIFNLSIFGQYQLRRVKFSFVRNVRKIISRFILIPNIDYCRWPAIFYRMTDELITQWHVYSENVLQHFTRSLDFFSIPNYCWRWQVSLRPRRSRSFPANPSATCQTFHNAVLK